MGVFSTALRSVHGLMISGRRAEVLSARIAEMLPQGARVLDIGCGDGLVESLIMARRPDVRFTGVDIRVRPDCRIEAREYDGVSIPMKDGSVDVAMIIDVLHHTPDPEVVLREACRVARRHVIIKDHLVDGVLAEETLRFMDWAGNAPYGTVLTYQFWTEAGWLDCFSRLGLTVSCWHDRLGLYMWPLSMAFDRRLHFLARLDVC